MREQRAVDFLHIFCRLGFLERFPLKYTVRVLEGCNIGALIITAGVSIFSAIEFHRITSTSRETNIRSVNVWWCRFFCLRLLLMQAIELLATCIMILQMILHVAFYGNSWKAPDLSSETIRAKP